MRTKLNITEGIFPMPVLMVATYNEDGSVNVMNAAWGTMQERDTVVLNLTETLIPYFNDLTRYQLCYILNMFKSCLRMRGY